jgi:hypothetical protein
LQAILCFDVCQLSTKARLRSWVIFCLLKA